MNNLMTESFERIRGRYPGENHVETANLNDSNDRGMKGFFEKVGKIEKQMENITVLFNKLQATNEEAQSATKASTMKAFKEQMEKDIEAVKQIALKIKTSLEELDRDNVANRQKQGCEKGTGVDRSRTAMTVSLKKKLKERMTQFQVLRQEIQDEYREVVERRIFTVTGTRPDEETIDHLIQTGNSEQIFVAAIEGHGRVQIMDTLAEIQERRDAFLELEKRLLDLQQMFLDMTIMVDAQGDMLNDIETQVTNAAEHVQRGNVNLKQVKKLQRNSRKWMCFSILILLVIIIIVVASVLKDFKKS
ncbi:syntaxin-132-like [Dioscorea cayenensis subsp. rotundata]|uniref:Syntaxin-132-like n=1 Tax=Dioscorea cayennensis subsp. rotundata TaxID=55577 RepID=A0AB40C3S2_DIOCR|nr:syntaxin-132-like [Dioscorea cayenensis subsp. rotundata]